MHRESYEKQNNSFRVWRNSYVCLDVLPQMSHLHNKELLVNFFAFFTKKYFAQRILLSANFFWFLAFLLQLHVLPKMSYLHIKDLVVKIWSYT